MLFFAGLLCSASASYAQGQPENSAQQNQSVADAARQERARKEEQQKTAKHVYTEEDLQRKKILTPEDQAKVEARKDECAARNNCAAPEQNAPAALDANGKSAQPSLGEIARELRKQKELEALKPKQSEPFHLPMDNPALASPILPDHAPVRPPVPPVLRSEHRSSENHANVFRRDPFAPVATRPRVPFRGASQLHPTVPSAARSSSSPAPKISPRAAAPSLPITPSQPSRPARDSFTTTPKSEPDQILPGHPSLPTRSRRATSSAIPSRIFPAVKPAAPLAPAESVNPAQPVPAPRQSIASVLAKTIRVQPGDSLWRLARRNFGRGRLWTAIACANPSVANPNYLHVGDSLVLPASSPAVVVAPSSVAKTNATALATIKVHKGETLWSLAKAHLGRAANWSCLAAANPSVTNPDRIFQGELLLLPAGCASVAPSSTSTRAN